MVMVKFQEKLYYIGNLLKINLDSYKQAVLERNTSCVMITDGRSGEGKSTLSFQVACYLDPEFSLDKVAFTPEQFIYCLKNAKKGDCIVFDEAMVISSRSAMSSFNRAIIIMMSQIRSKQIFVIFNINSIFDLDRNLALHRADCLFHVYSEDERLGRRGRYCVFPSNKGKLKSLYIFGKKYYSYSKPKSVFRDRFSSFFPFEDQKYEAKKQTAIDSFMIDHKPEGNHLVRKHRQLLIKYIKEENKLTNEEIADICNVSSKTIERILKENEK